MSGVFRNIDPLTARRVCTKPPFFVRGEDTLAGWRGGGGSIFWKTPDTALYSINVSTFWLAPQPSQHLPYLSFSLSSLYDGNRGGGAKTRRQQ